MNNVYVDGNLIKFSAKDQIGNGGEAIVYSMGNGMALKLFKQTNHPDYANDVAAQAAAAHRLSVHQTKLAAFPKNLTTDRVIKPIDLARDRAGNVVGYTMPYLTGMELITMLSQRSFRDAGYPNQRVVELFKDIHKTVSQVHFNKIVIGDENDLNILINPTKPLGYFIDADSWQFGGFPCQVFTQRFVDPLLCDPNATSLLLIKPHNELSDWYAYLTMLFYSLLFVGPYGGVYRPVKGPSAKQDERPLKRITVFNPEVKYPKPATHYNVLSDDLLQYCVETFEKDRRGVFPEKLLNMTWQKCPQCGIEHARNHCPNCVLAPPAAIKQAMEVRGNVTSKLVFRCRGRIVYATYQDKLRYVYHEDGSFKREGDLTIIKSQDNNQVKWRISGDATHIGMHGLLISEKMTNGFRPDTRFAVDSYQNIPLFDANSKNRFWVEGGSLKKDGLYGSIVVGQVLQNQTLFWIGENLGFGFYRAGNLSVAFIFNPDTQGINDSIKLNLKGQLVDSSCTFGKDKAWFFVTMSENGMLNNYAYMIDKNGKIEGQAQTNGDNNGWLGRIRGNCAAGNFLLVATDEGINRVEEINGQLIVTKKFPDCEPFVDSGTYLFIGKEGLIVVNKNEIKILEIK